MKVRKIIIAIMLIIICISGSTSKATFAINSADIYIKERAKTCLKLTTNNGVIGVTKVFYNYNGKAYPAYCINPELDGVGEYPGYSVEIEDVIQNPQVWRVITHGYPYKTLAELGVADEDEAYTATKQAVYCVINNYDLSRYGAVGEAGERTLKAMTKMVEYARTSTETKPSASITIKETSEWTIDEKNQNIIKTYEIISEVASKEYEVKLQDNKENQIKILDANNNETSKLTENKFKISIPVSLLTQDDKIQISVTGEMETYPILYGKSKDSKLQSYALAGEIYEIGESTIETNYYKNTSKVTIIKQDKVGDKKLEGVEFEIKNQEGKIIYSNLKTNSEGEIIIEGILPGKYYLKETQTVNGYQKLNDEIEFDIGLNEELKLTVENEKETTTVQKNQSTKMKKLPVTGK